MTFFDLRTIISQMNSPAFLGKSFSQEAYSGSMEANLPCFPALLNPDNRIEKDLERTSIGVLAGRNLSGFISAEGGLIKTSSRLFQGLFFS